MSHILDALKKLESEKKYKSPGSQGITNSLFRDPPPQSRARNSNSKRIVIIISSIVAAVVLLLAVRFLSVKPSAVKSAVPAPQTDPPPVKTAVPPQSVKSPPPPQPLPNKAETESSPEPPQQAPQPSAKKSAAGSKGANNNRLPLIPAPAEIKLSGIAWQDEKPLRQAVINGFLMKEGGTINGAVIVDILPDRVKLSKDGGFFELTLEAGTSANQPGTAPK